MKYLLDTHVLLWWLNDDQTLSQKARNIISDGKNVIFVSAAIIWEIRIKEALGKLKIPKNFKEVLAKESFLNLAITSEHAHAIQQLPAIHRDPFDRILIAQAKIEKMTLISRDQKIMKYQIPVLTA